MLEALAVTARAWKAHLPQYPASFMRYLMVSLSCSCSLELEEAELDPRLYDYVDGFESNAFDLGSDQYLSS